MKKKKSWREKLADDKGLPKVGEVNGRMSKCWGEGMMVIFVFSEVDVLMKQIPKNKLTTINKLHTTLTMKHKITFTYPITTKIFYQNHS